MPYLIMLSDLGFIKNRKKNPFFYKDMQYGELLTVANPLDATRFEILEEVVETLSAIARIKWQKNPKTTFQMSKRYMCRVAILDYSMSDMTHTISFGTKPFFDVSADGIGKPKVTWLHQVGTNRKTMTITEYLIAYPPLEEENAFTKQDRIKALLKGENVEDIAKRKKDELERAEEERKRKQALEVSNALKELRAAGNQFAGLL